jgi:hypothetical protein
MAIDNLDLNLQESSVLIDYPSGDMVHLKFRFSAHHFDKVTEVSLN